MLRKINDIQIRFQKNSISIVMALILCLTIGLTGCSKKSSVKPDVDKIRNIAKLATLKAYYNNIAKSEKTAGSGISHIFESNRKFWVEYTGSVNLGVDLSRAKIHLDGNKIIIEMPDAEIIGDPIIEKDSLNEASYIVSKDGINSNKITSDEQIKAIDASQKNMIETIKNNRSLLDRSEARAKKLIENYINKINEGAQNKYEIEWVKNGTTQSTTKAQ